MTESAASAVPSPPPAAAPPAPGEAAVAARQLRHGGLHEFPQVRDAWHRHEDETLKEAAREWLAYHEIDAELAEAPTPGPL